MEKGLTTNEAKKKIIEFGKNEIVTKENKNYFNLFFSQFPNLINGILAVAAIISFIIGNSVDGAFILIILLLNAILGFAQEYKAEKSLDKLKSYVISNARVIRDGKEIQIPTVDLVPKDLVLISEGDRVPADGKLIQNKSLEIDESILTGESMPVIKNHNDTAYLGTLVIKGTSRLLVEKTGIFTRVGQIAQTLSHVTSDRTPLQKNLDSLAKTLTLVTILCASFLIPLGIAQGKQILPLFILAISIAIAAIPESVPAIVTIALSIGVSRMARKQAIVRKMASVETLGAVQIILTDKTGTLTENMMRVKKYWTLDKDSLPLLIKASVFGNTAALLEKAGEKSFDVVGDKTDGALLLFANEKENIEDLKRMGKILDEYSFDPDTQTVTTIWENSNKKHVFVRGAPEVILAKSNLSEEEKNRVTKLFEEYAREGLRVIGFGSKTFNYQETMKREEAEKNLTFLGFVGIYDPPRKEARQAVKEAKMAGIKTIMVTGDNRLTAVSIAKEVGLIEKDEDVITGQEIEKLSDEDLAKVILKTRIFARAKPEDKLRLVSLFKKQGFIVGVTGDGVNDALALKKGDVGIAMGENGTDVAKEAADIVLTDDNFYTLVKAVEEGRTIYDNILKSITYLLSGNLSEIALVFFASILGMPNPLLPTQILWINLVTDGIPALALASDNKDPFVLRRKPRNPNAPILGNHRLIFILTTGLTLAIFYLLTFKLTLAITRSETFSRTVVFNVLIIFHLGIAFVVRGGSIFKMNKFLVLGVLFTLILQAVITFIPLFQNIFHLGF